MPDAAAESLVAGLLFVLVGLFTAGMGLYVRRSGDVTLIAGYRRLTVTDEDALARLVGTYVAVVGLGTVAVGVGYPLLAASARRLLMAGYLVALAVSLGAVWTRSRRYASEGRR